MLVFLDISNSNVNKLSDDLYNLKFLNASNTNIHSIPSTYTELISLNIINTKVDKIPNNLFKLKNLYCDYLPNNKYLNSTYKQLSYSLPIKMNFIKNIPKTLLNLKKLMIMD